MGTSVSPPPLKRRRPGTPPPPPPSSSSTDLRIFAWNINGITPFLPAPQKSITAFFKSSPATASTSTTAKTHPPASSSADDPDPAQPKASLRAFLRRHNYPHLLLLQEVKISPTDTATQTAVRRAIAAPPDSSEPDYTAHFVLPTDPHNAKGFGRKVHGVCSIVRTDFASAQGLVVRTVKWDLEGRFSILETDGWGGWPKLSIWNVYAVNGTEFEYRDSRTGMVVGTRHDRKLEVQRLMAEEVRRLEGEGYGVVLAGDMNVARDARDGFPGLRTRPGQHVVNRKDFVGKFFAREGKGLGMVDTFRELSGDERRYTYYSRGVKWGESCDRVDYIICSRSMEETLKEAGMLDSEQERGPSDHVPVHACFSFSDTVSSVDEQAAEKEDGG